MKKTISIIVVVISIVLLGTLVFASQSTQPSNQNVAPSQQALEKAQGLIKQKFPEDSKVLKHVASYDGMTWESDSAIFSATKDGTKIKDMQFKNVSSEGKTVINKSQAATIAETFINNEFPEIDLKNYKSETHLYSCYQVLFMEFDYKSGVELSNYITVYVNPETGEIVGFAQKDDLPNPTSIDLKINKNDAYQLALQKLTLSDATLMRSSGPKVFGDPETQKPVVGYSFVFINSSNKQECIFVNGTTGTATKINPGW